MPERLHDLARLNMHMCIVYVWTSINVHGTLNRRTRKSSLNTTRCTMNFFLTLLSPAGFLIVCCCGRRRLRTRPPQADVIALQEIDVGCARSGGWDVGDALARALGMNYVFVTEFQELFSSRRASHAQGGGVHGNGFLTRFDVSNVEAIVHEVRALHGCVRPSGAESEEQTAQVRV